MAELRNRIKLENVNRLGIEVGAVRVDNLQTGQRSRLVKRKQTNKMSNRWLQNYGNDGKLAVKRLLEKKAREAATATATAAAAAAGTKNKTSENRGGAAWKRLENDTEIVERIDQKSTEKEW